ncbi:MAG: DUF2461 domain-containing protein [Burkholderiales bacterium]|nr:DUF2461 domain-containing protein [Burkholderiales bacterium]
MHLRDLTQFLAELKENNNRAWFVMNKPRYDILREEFLRVVAQLIVQLAKTDPEVTHCDAKKALFRINRDVRFGADKSPYKTTFSASIVPSGRKKPSEGGGPAYYFHIDASGTLFIASGEYMPPPERLKQIREQIVADESGFGKVLKNKKLLETFGGIQIERERQLARPPKGYSVDSPHLEYLKLKDFMVWVEAPLQLSNGEELVKHLADTYKNALPLVSWLRTSLQLNDAE